MNMQMYNHVVLGGTFDHFHIGHEHLIRTALACAAKVTIGLTVPEMTQDKQFLSSLLSYDQRKADLNTFLQLSNRNSDVTIRPIADIYGGADSDLSLEAIVVTKHSLAGAEKINERRRLHGLPLLKIIVTDLKLDSSNEVISSTRIRKGEISRSGVRYIDSFTNDYELNMHARLILHNPLGGVFDDERSLIDMPNLVIIGDYSTQSIIDAGIPFVCSYVDGHSARKPFSLRFSPPINYYKTTIINSMGKVTKEAADHVLTSLFGERRSIYQIEGEEDLLTAVAILFAPLGYTVVYGNTYGKGGIVAVPITEERKQFIYSLLFS